MSDDPGLVGDYLDPGILRLATGGAAGMAELAAAGRDVGVVCDDDGRPRALLTPQGPAPLAVISADAPMRRVLEGDVAGFLASGPPGLVAVRDWRVTGFLTARAVAGYLRAHVPVRRAEMGDVQLHGPAAGGRMPLTCSTCGTLNWVTFYAAGTRCSQGHPLTRPWD